MRAIIILSILSSCVALKASYSHVGLDTGAGAGSENDKEHDSEIGSQNDAEVVLAKVAAMKKMAEIHWLNQTKHALYAQADKGAFKNDDGDSDIDAFNDLWLTGLKDRAHDLEKEQKHRARELEDLQKQLENETMAEEAEEAEMDYFEEGLQAEDMKAENMQAANQNQNLTIAEDVDVEMVTKDLPKIKNETATVSTGNQVGDFDNLWTWDMQKRSLRKVMRVLHRSNLAHVFAFIGIIALGLLFEVYVLQTTFDKDLTIKDALMVLGNWLAATFLFMIYVGAGWGFEGVSTFLDGYLVEMMLSVDNLFVFVLIMGSFAVPPKARSKVLMVGVLAALGLRIVMFGAIWFLIGWAEIISKALGAFIIYCAYKVVMLDEDDDEEITDNAAVKFLSTYMPMTTEKDENGSFFINGKATSIFLAAGAMIFLDIIFAVDSVSAKTALINSRYLSYTSTGFAMFALRATYYLLDAAKDMFEHLKYGISAILALIGTKTMFPSLFFISDLQYLFVLVLIMGSCMISSVVLRKPESQKEGLEV